VIGARATVPDFVGLEDGIEAGRELTIAIAD
jgi:hypothetical protein